MVYLSDELVELSQWLCHDDSTINIVITITVTIIKPVKLSSSLNFGMAFSQGWQSI